MKNVKFAAFNSNKRVEDRSYPVTPIPVARHKNHEKN